MDALNTIANVADIPLLVVLGVVLKGALKSLQEKMEGNHTQTTKALRALKEEVGDLRGDVEVNSGRLNTLNTEGKVLQARLDTLGVLSPRHRRN